jgi:hypothetical protein
MSLEALLNTCGHHHPDYLSDAVEKTAMRYPMGEGNAVCSSAENSRPARRLMAATISLPASVSAA